MPLHITTTSLSRLNRNKILPLISARTSIRPRGQCENKIHLLGILRYTVCNNSIIILEHWNCAGLKVKHDSHLGGMIAPRHNCRCILFRLLSFLQFYRYSILTVKKCTCRGKKNKQRTEKEPAHFTETILKTQKLKKKKKAWSVWAGGTNLSKLSYWHSRSWALEWNDLAFCSQVCNSLSHSAKRLLKLSSY